MIALIAGRLQSRRCSVRHSISSGCGVTLRAIWVVVGAIGGLVLGVIAGIAVALAVMQLHPRSDGTYGMREMLVCVPCGALIGLVAGLFWGFHPARG